MAANVYNFCILFSVFTELNINIRLSLSNIRPLGVFLTFFNKTSPFLFAINSPLWFLLLIVNCLLFLIKSKNELCQGENVNRL
jgi:hypothetical protein